MTDEPNTADGKLQPAGGHWPTCRRRSAPPPTRARRGRVRCQVTPRLVSVRVAGGDLTRFAQAAPTSHIKVFLPAPGQDAPTMPTMTPRVASGRTISPARSSGPTPPARFDEQSATLEIQFVLHGVGPGVGVGGARSRSATSSRSAARAAGSRLIRALRAGGSPATRARFRPSARCSTHSPRAYRPRCTWRSTAPKTRSRSRPRPTSTSPGITATPVRGGPNSSEPRLMRISPTGPRSGSRVRHPRSGASAGRCSTKSESPCLHSSRGATGASARPTTRTTTTARTEHRAGSQRARRTHCHAGASDGSIVGAGEVDEGRRRDHSADLHLPVRLHLRLGRVR